MISLDRLREIRRYIMDTHGWRDNCTPEERKEIWDACPGEGSFYSTVCRLINERLAEDYDRALEEVEYRNEILRQEQEDQD